MHGDLAARNTVRDPRRTGATAAALAIALTLASGLSVLAPPPPSTSTARPPTTSSPTTR
ncbi:hypothetical protein [Streptomyces sp. RKAG337]|uniref:hypothetical protein n=1 Tax=Streptomyces sp. RKAG337 TaxID=2893404 RepID=UPI0020348DDC|nr:hypothetical protein [Streptomyces sp. RKAG337]MCM2424305.1 hypothetical protein [Streptomyces sp. RKAG337]